MKITVVRLTLCGASAAFAVARLAAQPATAPVVTTAPVSQVATVGATATFTVVATGTAPLRFQWYRNGEEISRAATSTLTLANLRLGDAAVYSVRVSNAAGSVSSPPASLAVNGTAGTITTAPASVTAKAGTEARLALAAAGTGLAYEWRYNGRPLRTATGSALTLPNVGTTAAGYYQVTVTARNAPIAAAALHLQVTTDARLVNIATRGMVGPEDDEVLISGFVTRGTGSKGVLLRAVGPTLAQAPFNVTGVLANPKITLYRGSSIVATNEDWGGGSNFTAAFTKVGAFPLAAATSLDAAVLQTVANGTYTAHVTGPANARGIALIEVYDTDDASPPVELANISTRAMVGAVREGALIAGFVITGTTSNTVLVRGVSQSLGTLHGLRRALGNSQVAVFDAKGNPIAANAVWTRSSHSGRDDDEEEDEDKQSEIEEASDRTGAFRLPRGSTDSALLMTLPPGAYTAQVTGRNNASGVALVEIYEVR
ncbi:MAG: immunoglobulin domain-containing protein [Verrucomicrobia bacterium]|nr:immunoglobulin domain-containing protein [Verrucomicrobiota bacterium]